MKKLYEKIMSLSFRRAARVLAACAVAVAIVGGGASAALLAAQIGEAAAYVKAAEQAEDALPTAETASPERGGRSSRFEPENISLSEPSLTAKIVAAGTCAAALALGAAYWLLCAAWVWRAATLAGMSVRLWGALALLGNLAAAALFLAARGALRVKCPRCGSWQRRGHFCPACGAELAHYCPSCALRVSAKDVFCRRCGARAFAVKEN